MLIVSVPKQELTDAGKISNSVSLFDVKLRSVKVDENKLESFFDSENKTEVNLNINYRSSKKELIEGKTLTALAAAEATLTKGDAKVIFFVEYNVIYALPTVKIPESLTDAMFDAFARHNGLLNCWPYIRSQIANLSNEVGLPVLLPLLKIQAQAEQEVQKSL